MKTYPFYCMTVIALMSLGSCKKTNDHDPVRYPAREELNIPYGNQPLQKMDVYFPEGFSNNTPVAFIIHGGGFVAGTKEDFTAQALSFRKQGFITVNLSHRLVDTTGLLSLPPLHRASNIKVSDELADIDAAVKKYTAMAPGWEAGGGKMYMAGHSAGAILSMLYVNGDYNKDRHIRASGNWAGATDISIPHDSLLNGIDPRLIELYYRAAGAMPATSNNLYFMAISPYWVAFKNGGAAPNISIIPSNNAVFNIESDIGFGIDRTRSFHTLLRNYGVNEKLVIYEGEDHGFGTIPGSWDKLIVETAAFFRAN